jgi:hypothetical protein
MDIAKIDQPACLPVISGPAAGEGGHAAIKARAGAAGKSPIDWGLGRSMATAARGC